MNPQGWALSIDMQDEAVLMLQSALRQIGFMLDTKERYFSKATRKAVLSFQRRNAPKARGEIEKQRFKLIDPEVDHGTAHAR
jgi:peptidoglycan hydrolase-like protein with peptidoglycan-binding domain